MTARQEVAPPSPDKWVNKWVDVQTGTEIDAKELTACNIRNQYRHGHVYKLYIWRSGLANSGKYALMRFVSGSEGA